MKTYRCIKEFEIENYTIEKLTLWTVDYFYREIVGLRNLSNNKVFCLSTDILEEHFEEVK